MLGELGSPLELTAVSQTRVCESTWIMWIMTPWGLMYLFWGEMGHATAPVTAWMAQPDCAGARSWAG